MQQLTYYRTAGKFLATTGITDSNDNVAFVFTAPQVDMPLNLAITANAAKAGYASGENHAVMAVNPEPAAEIVAGLPMTTILIILIPVVIVVIAAILIKLKIISFSFKERI